MIRQPTADELLEAVGLFIEGVSGQLADRDKFLARVASNAIGVVRRELREGAQAEERALSRLKTILGSDGDYETLNHVLCAALAEGRFDDVDPRPLLDHLRASATDRVRIDQPGYSGLAAVEAAATSADAPQNERS